MTLQIVVMTGDEEFLRFLDPELCTLVETQETGGLKTLELEYTFQDLHEDKQLFRIGNKVWISGDTNLSDCLYVINTIVETDVYENNQFKLTLEEVLVELNYAPVTTQNELTSANGFTITTSNGEQSVTVNYNALNYWFGDYYNIGVVQQCLNAQYNKISLSGTMNPMSLLRYIEEQTGNIFVTRYEKDCLDNTIHRYLDFLNPLDVSKDWELNLYYDFVSEDTTGDGVYDENNNPTTDTYDDVEEEDDNVDWASEIQDHTPVTNMDPSDIEFRITDREGLVLNSDGLVYADEEETPLVWTSTDIGFDGTEENIAFTLSMVKGGLGLVVNNRTFIVPSSISAGEKGGSFISVANDPDPIANTTIPDDSYFEIYDTVLGKAVYRTCLNREIGHVHEDILDFGFNIENVIFETDEEDTFTAISPLLGESETGEGLSRTNLSDLITKWKNLSIPKGTTVPMIVEKINVKASSLSAAKSSLGTFNRSNNYWSRPYNPQDNIDTSTASNSTFEFLRATAYWKAPFTKEAGELHVKTDNVYDTEYTTIYGRQDTRDDYLFNRPKMGNVETSDEDIYAIYNDVAMKLKDKLYKKFNITVDVANLRRKGEFNNYELHDKVYVKLPDYQELVSARVVKTSKEAHDVSKNTIELSNYAANNVKAVSNETLLNAENLSFKYPATKAYSVRLENLDYNSSDEYSVQYPANKLISFIIYKVENQSSTLTKTSYNKLTNANGYATIQLGLDPGDYEIKISFGGDEEYEESNMTVKCNVSGTKEIIPSTNTSKVVPKDMPKQKTTKKTNKTTTKTTKRYYTKYGVSPDGKYLMAIGRPSASGELAKYGYKFYKTVFKRKCPFCGSKELYWSIFWAGNEHGNWGKFPATGKKEGGSAEGHIFCKKCDADFSTITGANHGSNPKKLKMHKKPVKCTKTDGYTLKKGKMYYDTVTEKVKSKNVTSTKDRTIPSGVSINAQVQKLALSIVGNSTGLAAAKKIARWCGHNKNLRYDYYANFRRGPKTVMNKGGANCCDSTRFMLTLMVAAGCAETLKLEYVHVTRGREGHVFAKITTKSSGKWRYVDPVLKFDKGRNPWGHWYRGCGTTFSHRTEFPTLPF